MTSCTGHSEVKAGEGGREEAAGSPAFNQPGRKPALTRRGQQAAAQVPTATLNRSCKGREADRGSRFCWSGPVRTGGRLVEGGEKKGEEQETEREEGRQHRRLCSTFYFLSQIVDAPVVVYLFLQLKHFTIKI